MNLDRHKFVLESVFLNYGLLLIIINIIIHSLKPKSNFGLRGICRNLINKWPRPSFTWSKSVDMIKIVQSRPAWREVAQSSWKLGKLAPEVRRQSVGLAGWVAAVNPSSYNGILAITPDSEGFSGSSSQFRNHHAAAHLLTRGILEIRLFGAGTVSWASQAWGFLSISDFSDFGFIWLVRPQLLTMSQILVVKSWGYRLGKEATEKQSAKKAQNLAAGQWCGDSMQYTMSAAFSSSWCTPGIGRFSGSCASNCLFFVPVSRILSLLRRNTTWFSKIWAILQNFIILFIGKLIRCAEYFSNLGFWGFGVYIILYFCIKGLLIHK